MTTLTNYIGGAMQAPLAGRYLDNVNPATGKVHGRTPESDEADIAAAVAAANAAFPAWAGLPASERAAALRRLAALIARDHERLAQDESADNGKPVHVARAVDIPRAIQNLEFFAAAATQFSSECHAMEGRGFNYTLRQPLGAVACISPWNLPLYLLTWKIAPALASGNTVVAKPSEVTPLTAFRLSELAIEAGLPPGVLNIVHGSGPSAGAPLVDHHGIKAVSFTGGTATGRAIAQVVAPKFKKMSLEMGGKNPAIVFADTDLERTADAVTRAAFSNQGQICLCGSRILVEQSVYTEFRDLLIERANRLKVGDPELSDTDQGAVVSAAHRDKVLQAIETARDAGGNILCGGAPITLDGRCREGYFIAPTLIDGLPADAAANQVEIFGPVATLLPFDNDDEALALANGTEYGLAASLFSRDVDRCHRMAANLEFGIVWVNCWMLRDLRTPFGGMRQSGVGREGGFEALRFFTEPKNITVAVRSIAE